MNNASGYHYECFFFCISCIVILVIYSAQTAKSPDDTFISALGPLSSDLPRFVLIVELVLVSAVGTVMVTVNVAYLLWEFNIGDFGALSALCSFSVPHKPLCMKNKSEK